MLSVHEANPPPPRLGLEAKKSRRFQLISADHEFLAIKMTSSLHMILRARPVWHSAHARYPFLPVYRNSIVPIYAAWTKMFVLHFTRRNPVLPIGDSHQEPSYYEDTYNQKKNAE